jgi:hypothetical protein
VRTGAISAGGQQFRIDQQAPSPSCNFSINPARANFDNAGDDVRVVVSTGIGCSWTAVGRAAWLTIVSGASGKGSGAVVVRAAPNPAEARTGTVTIAGQTFSASQGAGVCGAVDVTSRVIASRGGLSWIPWTSYLFQSTFTVRNTSGSAIPGPVYVVFQGLPYHANYPDDAGLWGSQALTYCYRSVGDYLILILTPGGLLAPGQSVKLPLVYRTQRRTTLINFTRKVVSGKPSKRDVTICPIT